METPELIAALDVPHVDEVAPQLERIGESVSFYKIGLELFTAAGPHAIETVTAAGKRVFLDLKLHDIPRTVANAVKTAARHGVALMTVHAGGGRDMLRAAAEAAAELGPDAPRLVAVTVLTSLDQNDLTELGIMRPVADHALALGELAINAGIDGLVCSVHEAAALRQRLGPQPLLVTPGIRPAGTSVGDQKRVATPALAARSGASFIVVGRPILQARNPRQAAEQITAELAAATHDTTSQSSTEHPAS